MSYSTLISAGQLKSELGQSECFIFDCRFELASPGAGFKKFVFGHIPTAQYVHLDNDLSSPVTLKSGRHPLPSPNTFLSKLKNWGLNNDAQVICYDDNGGAFASRMWWLFKWIGHENVAVLNGGIQSWIGAGYEISTAKTKFEPGDFSGIPNDDLWVDVEYIEHRLSSDTPMILIDARSNERFTARDTATDPVPGHIPSAVSLPFAGNLTSEGQFLDKQQLHKRFNDISVASEHTPIVVMCGSGVTACHNLLALEVAGVQDAKLYVGSWSEWIRNPMRPVATGNA